MKRLLSSLFVLALFSESLFAGLLVSRSNGITLTGVDGIQFVGLPGLSTQGTDGFLGFTSNGFSIFDTNGITLTGADGITLTGADGTTLTGPNGITLTGADGITLTGADGISLSGADGITLIGPNGISYTLDSVLLRRPNGITLTGADGITLTGVNGITLTGADGIAKKGINGITLTGADGIALTGANGITLTGADGIAFTGADSLTGITLNGQILNFANPAGIVLTGADDIRLTSVDGIALTGVEGITLTGIDGHGLFGNEVVSGLEGLDADLAQLLDRITDDSNINAIITFHGPVTEADLNALRSIGIIGGTRFRQLPMVYVLATKQQILAISRLPQVRSVYGNRTLQLTVDPYFERTQINRVPGDAEIRSANGGLSVTGRDVGVAVLDTGINALNVDLAGKVAANVKLLDLQSVPLGFSYPIDIEGLPNTDLLSGHGTFVGGIIAGNGTLSNGKFAGVAPGAKLIGLSSGLLNLTHVLSGFDYILEKRQEHNIRIVNCSFSADVPFDLNDPVNIGTKMLVDVGINVVFSAGNNGPGTGTLNPYARAPWVIGVGASDRDGKLAKFSSRGSFGGELNAPSLVAPGVSVASIRSLVTLTGSLGVLDADLSRLSLLELPFYTTASGTSFSAPQVAGAIALMLEADPNLTPAEVKDILLRSATPMPGYYKHEVGAGMLNTHAAVLEASFPQRKMGSFRSITTRPGIRFITSTSSPFTIPVQPGSTSSIPISLPQNTLQATVSVYWGFSLNDFGLGVYRPNGSLAEESNIVNLPLIGGRREKVLLTEPTAGTYQARIRHTLGLGSAQNVFGAAEITRVDYSGVTDLGDLNTSSQNTVKKVLRMGIMLPKGEVFGPGHAASRSEFAETFVRAGFVPQYLASSPVFPDVLTLSERNFAESAHFRPGGSLFFDTSPGGQFRPFEGMTKLAAAIAYVKAARLENSTTLAILPLTITDRLSIPLQWRGHVAVALNRGLIKLDGNRFNPNRPITRLELAEAVNSLPP
ncbi:S8 family serine peptidase [Leptolyngbya sp. 7M]|uniref:S8 family serine peptidase n=1 Tax=Leptolyngbya sp. 7M TaxID=2812896 RepID=UPI001B8B2379|nr:S8 family serine peptidase [Leptolyngbya sp. 7M]QYO66347.1 S8 family serine peptidase [Leptolyngbya sp. 7M]